MGAYVIAGQYTGFNNTVYDDIWLAKLALYPADVSPAPTPTIIATPTPSPVPSVAPTANPTQAPTAQPTTIPTQSPTQNPADNPLPSPTIPEFTLYILIVIMAIALFALPIYKKKYLTGNNL